MRLSDLPTPCLVLDRTVLRRNLDRMRQVAARQGVALRPHMKTAKSIDVARLALDGVDPCTAGIAVSTLAEAEYFVAHDIVDILYAVGITPAKLDAVAGLNAAGGAVIVITDDAAMAARIAAHPAPPRALIEIDCGEGRAGLDPEAPALLEVAAALGPSLAGVMTHGGQSYATRAPEEARACAAAECRAAVRAAERLRAAGFACPIVSVGSSPTAVHGERFAGVTELRAGVYMFGDLFQAVIGTHGLDDIAVTVLASVIGGRPAADGAPARILLDAGALALSKDRSTEATGQDMGYGLMLDLGGARGFGQALVRRVWQEHALVTLDPASPAAMPVLGDLVRIAPNHACLTAAAHDRYHVVEGDDVVVAVWPRVNGW